MAMTLAIAGLAAPHSFLLCDRRLSRGDRRDDESNKMTVLFTADAKLAIAFTGLARAGSFDTNSFIGKTLVDVAEPERMLMPMRDRFIAALEAKVRQLPISQTDKRLSLVFVGYHYEEDDPSADHYNATGILWRASNFQREDLVQSAANDHFEVEEIPPRQTATRTPYGFLTAGTTTGLPPVAVKQLEQLLHERKPPKALAGKALDIGFRAARDPRSGEAIGTSWTVAVIPIEPRAPVWAQYYADSPRIEHFEPNFIDASAGDQPVLGLNGMVIETREPHAFGFPGTPRNAECPCGSRLKYKHCHGKPTASIGGTFFNRLLEDNDRYRNGLLRPDKSA